jgi:hypothetical protein
MRLLFYRSEHGGLYDRLYSWKTSGPYSRIVLQFFDGTIFGVSLRYGIVSFNLYPFDPCYWDAVEFYGAEDVIRSFCQKQTGRILKKSYLFSSSFREWGTFIIGQAFCEANYKEIDLNGSINDFYSWAKNWVSCNPLPVPPFPKVCRHQPYIPPVIFCPPPTPYYGYRKKGRIKEILTW